RLYLHRYHAYEARLAAALRARAGAVPAVDEARLEAEVGRLFPGVGEDDRQRAAAVGAARSLLSIVVGGPGTGKTTTVVRLLALCQSLAASPGALRVALLAPTGKAAARLEESVHAAARELDVDDAVRRGLVARASTIHRALGFRPGDRASFAHDAANPLPVDLVVVDEASMVDLPLMAKLVDAVPPHARLVLLGDRRQLASVEVGAVLADLCAAADAGGPLADRVVELVKVYRYDESSGVGRLAAAVRTGDPDAVRGVLAVEHDDLTLVPIDAGSTARSALDDRLLSGFGGYLAATSAADRLARLDDHRVLTAHRRGRLGVGAWNDAIRERLVDRGTLARTSDDWYDRRPVLVTRNDASLGLSNGDVGVCLEERTEEGRRTWRVAVRGREGEVRILPAARIPAPETVFAMTVHKSQGSEFDHVCLVVPPRESPILTRELLYTGLTRARRRLTLLADPEILARAVERRIRRASGLVARLSSD
ncbi:MAG: exodeoxyribonuclease V subunit alpha, partial [Planctomycetota bacterium JB042]